MNKYILTIDQGTTSTRALLIDKDINILKTSQIKLSQKYPHNSYIEQDANEIFASVKYVIEDILKNVKKDNIETLALTNQRETTVVWDKKTGEPVYNAIVWQSTQTKDICKNYIDSEEMIKQKTGLPLNPYFSASKIRFILDHIKDGQKRAENNELAFGTIDSFIVYKLTGNHYTDYSNASRTLLFNIHELKWDDELLRLFNIPKCMLAEVKNTADYYGNTEYNIPINCVVGDQQAATFGQLCFDKSSIKATYGTGLFILANTGTKAIENDHGLLTTILWSIDGKVNYALEGSVFFAASALEWLKDSLHIYNCDDEIDPLLDRAHDDSKLIVIPTFAGLATPYWKSSVKGAMYNISRTTSDSDILKSTIETIAFQCRDVVEIMKKYLDDDLFLFKADGGMSMNDYFLQFQADSLEQVVKRPTITETTALGAALLAGLHTKIFADEEQIKLLINNEQIFTPKNNVETKYKAYKHAIKSLIEYHDENPYSEE